MHFGVDLFIVLSDGTVGADDERLPRRDLCQFPVPQHAVGFRHLAIHVGKQDERQFVLLGEFLVGIHVVQAHAYDVRTDCLECIHVVAEVAGFFGTARRVVLGIEVDGQPFPAIIGQVVPVTVLVLQPEARRFAAQGWRFVRGIRGDEKEQQGDRRYRSDEFRFHGVLPFLQELPNISFGRL